MWDELREKLRLDELGEKLNVDGMREWINNNSAAVTVGAVAILLVSLAVIIRQGGSGPKATPGEAYFYDTTTKELITDKATRIPPITTPEGHEAVRAHYFTCGECTDSQRFLGYYEKYSPEVKEKLEKNPQSFELYEMAFQGRLYCAPDKDPNDPKSWVGAESPAGFQITEDLQKKCPVRKLRYCPPR